MIGYIIFGVLVFICLTGFRIVRPTHRMAVETFGKWTRNCNSGLAWIIPLVQQSKYVNLTEQMVDVEPQMVITKDKLNAEVDAVVYYKVQDIKKCLYNVDDHKHQLTSLARTTLRAVVGKMTLTNANENRDRINTEVEKILDKETDSYGVEVLRVEIQRIEPPQDVQKSMNEVVKAEQKKIAANDTATALETEADGQRRASIKIAEGNKRSAILNSEGLRQSNILEAEGIATGKKTVADANAYKIKVENESAQKYFTGKAEKLKQLEVTQNSLKENSKIVLGQGGKDILKMFNIDK